jgi:putative pyoverdin transport system ATP-binding/permease protein
MAAFPIRPPQIFMVQAIQHVFRNAKAAVLLSAAASLASGVCNVWLLAMVGTAINKIPYLPAGYGVRFAGVLLAAFAASVLAQLLSIHLTANFAATTRMQLSRAIMDSPLRTVEDIGNHTLIAVLTQDAGSIAQAALQVPQFGMNAAIILCCIGYLAYLSWPIFLAIVLMLPVSVAIYFGCEYFAIRFLTLERENWDQLVKHFQMLTHGIKELKLNRTRRAAFFVGQLLRASGLARRYGLMGASIYVGIISWSNLLCFAAIGVIVFVLPRMTLLGQHALVNSALVALFLRIPIAAIVDSMREFNRASVAFKKLANLGVSWKEAALTMKDDLVPETEWSRIDLVNVAHEYSSENEDGNFVLGPISLTLTPGRIMFITGGNGSGKTTLAKLIVGLYKPESGAVKVNGVPIDESSRDDYRQYFSAIFSEYALFQDVLDQDKPGTKPAVDEYLRLLRLDHKVHLRNGKLSTLSLSAGQKRRLALLHAYLEDRPVYLFDEWAADQDPAFKEIFYCQLLPDLRSRGKAVVVISHDDRYYHVADEVVRLESGRIVLLDEEPQRPHHSLNLGIGATNSRFES